MGRPNWRQLLGDLTIVVVGILLALWVDGEASARAERSDRARIVADLSSDLARDSAQLDNVIEFQAARTADLEALILASKSGSWPSGSPALSAVLNTVGIGTLTSTADTYEDLETSGRLAEILSRDERVRLRQYYRIARGPFASKAGDWRDWALGSVRDPYWRLLLPGAPTVFDPGGATEEDGLATAAFLEFLSMPESQGRLRTLLAEAHRNMRALDVTRSSAIRALEILRGT